MTPEGMVRMQTALAAQSSQPQSSTFIQLLLGRCLRAMTGGSGEARVTQTAASPTAELLTSRASRGPSR